MKNENDKTLLTVKNLSKSYWNDGLEIAVLRNINLTVKEG